MYYTYCAEWSVIYHATYVIKMFLYYTYDHCCGVFWKFLVFSFSSEKKLSFKIWKINRLKWNDFFFKKNIIWMDKLKFKNISIYIIFKSIDVWKKHMKKDREEKTKFSEILPNNQIITACHIELWV